MGATCSSDCECDSFKKAREILGKVQPKPSLENEAQTSTEPEKEEGHSSLKGQSALVEELREEEDGFGGVEQEDYISRKSMSQSQVRLSMPGQTPREKYESQSEQFRFLNRIREEGVLLECGSLYSGDTVLGLPDGHGRKEFPDGRIYNGFFQMGVASGFGCLEWAKGDSYVGTWLDDKSHGQGKFSHSDGSWYDGEWQFDMQDGKGVEHWSDGSSYEGEYKMGKKHGVGKYIFADGGQYEGSWRENMFNGFGKYTWTDGRSYEGHWLRNKMHGKGVYTFQDGRKYEGEYFMDQKHVEPTENGKGFKQGAG